MAKKNKLHARTFSMFWAGDAEAFNSYVAAQMNAGSYVSNPSHKEEDQLPDLLSIDAAGLGLVEIKGVLTNEDNWWNSYEGLVSYNEIRDAVNTAAALPEVKEILVDISSPGGSVNGVLDAVEAISNANALKPLTVYSDSVMTSGGYWLAAPAAEKYISPIATAGLSLIHI